MKTSQLAALLGVGIGVLLIYLAYNSGERVIIGEMEDMRPIFGHVLNKPMLAAGIAVVAASVVVFGFGFRTSPAGAGRTDVATGETSPNPAADAADPPASESEISDARATERSDS